MELPGKIQARRGKSRGRTIAKPDKIRTEKQAKCIDAYY